MAETIFSKCTTSDVISIQHPPYTYRNKIINIQNGIEKPLQMKILQSIAHSYPQQYNNSVGNILYIKLLSVAYHSVDCAR